MAKSLGELKQEWDSLNQRLNEAIAEYHAVRRIRSDFQVKLIFPEDKSAAAMTEFHHQEQQAIADLPVNLQHIDQDIKVAVMKVKNLQASLRAKQSQMYETQAQIIWEKLIKQSAKINKLSDTLETEIKVLREINNEFDASLSHLLPAPPVFVKIAARTFPYIYDHHNYIEIGEKQLNIDADERG
ncbi:MAG: hypothetical protein P5681_08965 [Limnospira sp. PMC 894.15]|uniref:hypothetical protein n=1 Tax=unclassified Limnospira TaxID=2642885 RepID=UPI0028E0FE3A|nr:MULTISPECIES: hypothetical protein [unclassified Limnospira]MDT9187938.1 hypothetical protein [Limnospira sp. PMC 894.15]MDT9276909.1 hypothetical protein [Limnospira sp. PMC 737.11]